jgi:hypothetical protein
MLGVLLRELLTGEKKMTTSYASVAPQNFELTPCRVTYNSVDLGGTHGNVKVALNYTKAEMKADQYGETVLDRRVSGFNSSVEFVLAEVNDITKWAAAMPNATIVGTAPNRSVVFLSKVGESDIALSHALNLHPLSQLDASLIGDLTFVKAVAESVTEITFGPTEQQGLKVKMNIYPDTSVSPAKFAVRGDSSIGFINASFAAAVYTGTGNGTLTNISVTNAAVTETVTVMCVGIPAANKSNWLVSGATSGVIGYAAITSGSASGLVNFTSSKISFTITDGSTDFIIGDNWTIAVTGGNYV